MMLGILQKLSAGAARLCDFTSHFTSFSNRRMFQHYGFVSGPPDGSEVVAVSQGDLYIVIASENRTYRLAVDQGEVALYDNKGSKIHLKKNGEISIESSEKVVIKSGVIELGTTVSKLMTDAMITVYNAHTHADPVSGSTGIPSGQLSALHATSKTKAE